MYEAQTTNGYKMNVPKSFDKYQIKCDINNGFLSSVVKVYDIDTSCYYAAKIMPIKLIEEKNLLKNVYNEICILEKIDHPYIIKYKDSFIVENNEKEEFVIIIEEYCSNGTLFDHIQKNYNQKKEIIMKIAEGIKYLHNLGIAHCDIKLENILLDDNYNPKICDFNFAICSFAEYKSVNGGTYYYKPPEFEDDINIDYFKCDIWSFAITIYAFITEYYPYETVEKAHKGNFLILLNDIKLSSIVKKCLRTDPKLRPNIEEILNETYFSVDKSIDG